MASGEKLRIVHCVRAPIGGIYRHIADLASEQARAGHHVGLICDSNTIGRFETQQIDRLRPFLELGIETLPMEREIHISDFKAGATVFGMARAMGADVLHGHGSKGGAFVRIVGTLLRLAGQKPLRIYCPHGGSLHYDARSAKGRILFGLERFFEFLTDRLIFVSAYERDEYSAKVGVPRVPAEVVYNGLAKTEFEPVVAAPVQRDFLYIGMLRAIKGPDVFIRAMKALRDDGTAVTAHMVGDGPEREDYKHLTAEMGLSDIIRFHDQMPARDAFSQARTIVVPSRGESMPYIVLEAVAAQMPIVATRVGGIPEIFMDDSERLVPPDDVDALADAMRRALEAPEAMREEARVRANQLSGRFSVAIMAESVERIYRDALTPGRQSDRQRHRQSASSKAVRSLPREHAS